MRRATTKRLPVVALVTGVLVATAIVASGGLATAVTGPVIVGGTYPADVAISGDRVVWADQTYGHYDIFLFDGSTGDTTRVTTNKGDQLQPDIDGDFVVWTDYRDGDADIWIYDIATGVQSELTEAANDQIEPTISGNWVAWEDYRSGYTPGIYAMDLGAPVFGGFKVDYDSNQPRRHPVVRGDLLVWEDFSGQSAGRGDPDVRGADLGTFDYRNPTYLEIATDTTAHERAPWTDGRYVVYSVNAGDGSDVWAWDSQTGTAFALDESAGEQAGPVASDGVAYWLVNDGDTRLHYRAADLETGRSWTFNSYGSADMAGFDASGGNAAWLESTGGSWKVRAVLNDEVEAALVTAARSMPVRLAWVPHRLADIVSGSDDEAPAVLSASVDPGETQVESDRTLAVYFSEAMDPTTIDGGAVSLIDDESGEPVAAEVAYSALADAVTVEPEDDLGAGSYTLAVSGAVTDESGNVLGQDYFVSFSQFVTFNADTTPPSRPSLRDIRTVGLTDVELTWSRARDNVGVVGYHIYRYGEPMSNANVALAEHVDTVVGGSKTQGTISVAVDERLPRKYTYYYAVRAYDAEGNLSDVSTNMTPNPHGTYVLGGNTNNCAMCHSVHGVTTGRADLNAKSAEACYECHGDTESLSSYGYASTIDEEYDFYSDDGDAGRATATRHYNDYMMASQAECDSCHTPHRKPAHVDLVGTKDDALSLSKILKRPVDPSSGATVGAGVFTYSTDAVPFGNEFCTSCHGVESAYMTSRGGNNAYSDAGGNHETGFDAGAHGSTMVLSSARPVDDPGPAITCYACHNEHATQTRGLTDWRQSGVRDTTYDQAGLCFACHSASYTAETRTNSGNAFFAWNGRNVQTEFGKASRHPYSASSGGSTQTVQNGLWSQTTEADFATDDLTSVITTDVGDGGVALEYQAGGGGGGSGPVTAFYDGFESGDWTNTLGVGGAWSTVNTHWWVDTSKPSAGTYNAHADNPARDARSNWFIIKNGLDLSALTDITLTYDIAWGGVLETTDDFRVQKFRLGAWQDVRDYNFGAGDPQAQPTFINESFTLESDVTGIRFLYNSNWDDDDVYVDEVMIAGTGGGSGGLPSTETEWTGWTDSNGGTAPNWVTVGTGGNPGARAEFQRSGSSNTGYYTKSGFDFSGVTDATMSFDWISDGHSGNGGTIEPDADFFRVEVDDGGGWVTVFDSTASPPGPADDDQAPIAWTASGVLDISNGSVNVDGVSDVSIRLVGDATQDSEWWAIDNLAFDGTVAAAGPGAFISPGDVVSTLISIPGGTHQGWGDFTFNGTEPGTSTIRFSVLDSGGVPITGFEDFTLANSPVDLSTIDENTYATLKVKADLTGGADSPVLTDWSVGYSYLPPASLGDGQLTCTNCHNTHVIQTGGASTIWDMDRVSDPDNTKNIYAGTPTEFCLECHDGATPTAQMSASTIVPYSVGMTDYSSKPFFPGWDKSGFSSNAHASNGTRNMSVGCEDCHDPHGSDNDRLVASTIDYSGSNSQHYDHDRDDTANISSEEELCYNCHTNDRTPNCEGGSCHAGGATNFDDLNVQTAFGETYKHDVGGYSGDHSDLEDPSDPGFVMHVECVDCHDVHSATAANPMMGAIGVVAGSNNGNWGVPSGWSADRIDGVASVGEANVCFKCHSDYADSPVGGRDIAQEFNPDNQSGHNVFGTTTWPKTVFNIGGTDYTWSAMDMQGTVGGNTMECSSCHAGDDDGGARGPHGGSVAYIIDEAYPGSYGSATINNYSTTICAKCHTDVPNTNSVHGEGNHGSEQCTACHIQVPHGWKRPRMLGYTDDPAPYATDAGGLWRLDLANHSSWSQEGDCMTPSSGCYDAYHGQNFAGPYWP